jgi:uncharacterized membrane protein
MVMTKAVKFTFLASLVLNLFLLGVLLGQVPRGLETTPWTRQQRLEAALKKLPEPAQSRLREKFTRVHAATDPLRRQIDEARAEMLGMLSAEPFDETAYDHQVNRIQDLRSEMFKRMGRDFKQTAQELSPEERRMLADLLRRPPPSSK